VEKARKVYARYVNGGKPAADEYKALQDYIFRYIAREASRIGLVVHIHPGFGDGRYFDVQGSNPLLLEPVFNDPIPQNTKFVIIHGGWPFAKQTAAMLLKPNVYADFSAIAFLIYPRELSEIIRSWLEIQPQKVMFGTDSFDVGYVLLNWEELTWLGTDSSRRVLALALTGMMNDGEITSQRATEIARKVLRENAIKLYKLNGS
jgi:predicted TIM-barrel fold metal-dependent hydrolase